MKLKNVCFKIRAEYPYMEHYISHDLYEKADRDYWDKVFLVLYGPVIVTIVTDLKNET